MDKFRKPVDNPVRTRSLPVDNGTAAHIARDNLSPMTPTGLLRPMLVPGLARVWRGPHTLQLGLDPARAVLIDLPDPRAAGVLDLLDGVRPERLVLAQAAAAGVTADDTHALLDTLHRSGFVLPGPSLLPCTLPDDRRRRLTGEAAALALERRRPGGASVEPDRSPTPARLLRRRGAARVVISGPGRLAAPIAVALAEAGVGHVHAEVSGAVGTSELPGGPLRAGDVGRSRAEAITAAVRRVAPGVETHAVRRGAASLVIQLGHDQPVALLAAGHARRGQAHLAVTIREGCPVVGPLVPPTGRPCLQCVSLHRRDRDAGWPETAGRLPGTGIEPCAVATLLAATGYATAEALACLDGGSPETLGAAVEISAPGRFRRRTWPPHPDCPCASARSTWRAGTRLGG